MKKTFILCILCIGCSLNGFSQSDGINDNLRLLELNKYWDEVSQTINKGDFEGYAATFHKDAVLVTGIRNKAYPIATALAGWKKDFDDTKAGLRKSSVEFRFNRRLGDGTTAHESGIFFYSYELEDEKGGYSERIVTFEVATKYLS